VQKDAFDTEGVGDQAGVLTTGTTERRQRVLGDVVATLHRDLLDGVGHVLDGDAQKAFGELFGGLRGTAFRVDIRGQGSEFSLNRVTVERPVGIGAKDVREVIRLQLAEQYVAVGHRQRTVATVAGGTGIGTGRGRADLQPAVGKAQDGTATGGDGVDLHHRRTHPHPGDQAVEAALVFAGVMRDVGRRAAHVEADNTVKAGNRGTFDNADHATGRTGEDRVLALEQLGVGEATMRLHEHQSRAAEFGGDTVDVAAQDRRQVGVDHRGVAATDQLDQRADPMRDRDLGEAGVMGDFGNGPFVVRVAVAVQQADGHRTKAVGVSLAHRGFNGVVVERRHHCAVGSEPFRCLDHPVVEHLREDDLAVEQARPVLGADAQHVGKTGGGHQQCRITLALEQGVGCDRSAHLHRCDSFGRNRGVMCHTEQVADAGQGGVRVLLRVFRKQLEADQRAVRAATDDVGEGAAAVDPELPAVGGG